MGSLKELAEVYYLEKNFNCAESILRAANDLWHLGITDTDLKLVGGFGGGMQVGSSCGAILSAIAVISRFVVEEKAHASGEIKPMVTAFMVDITTKLGSSFCDEIKPKVFVPEVRCLTAVHAACDLLEKMLTERGLV